MEINLGRAVSTFHPNPSYEQVYFESVANALDAGADQISIKISIDSFDLPETLSVEVTDNGLGFSDKSFEKFSRLLEVENNNHKGLGRLVYLSYFKSVSIESSYDEKKRREFSFNSEFNGESKVFDVEKKEHGSKLHFHKYQKSTIHKYAYLTPRDIKSSLIQQFFPLFFKKKENDEKLTITIELEVEHPNLERGFSSEKSCFTLDDLPPLKTRVFEGSASDLFEILEIHYSVDRCGVNRSISSAICVDDRAIEYDLIPVEAIPLEYQLRFIFISDYFVGKTNSSRQRLVLPDDVTERTLKTQLREKVSSIINDEIPTIQEDNQKTKDRLNKIYPHLIGYFPQKSAGLIQRTVILKEAQESFFTDQKSILECEELNEEQYKKALELSARALAEYVMYRTRIISKLKDMTPENDEKELHQLIVPMRQTLQKEGLDDDIYSNNVWMLDDRFMTYSTILSDETMKNVIKEIALEDVEDSGRPDITLVFSGNPNKDSKVSVVVVELKKQGLKLAKNEEVLSQLRQRARKLLRYFPDKIERIWFYGITDINSEFRISLIEDGYKELFSHGQMFFKPQDIIVDDEKNRFTVDLFVMTYNSLVQDAESRNSTFLNVLKSTIRRSVESNDAGQN